MQTEKPDFTNFSCSWIYHATFDLIEGKADPDSARMLLEYFCYAFDNQERNPEELLGYLRNAFRDFLDNEKNIDAALGLVKKKGRPNADSQVEIDMATEVLRLRLKSVSHQEALTTVSEKFGYAESKVGEAWAKWQIDAILKLRMERPLDENPWTQSEIAKMDKIFSKKQWYLKPENQLDNITPEK